MKKISVGWANVAETPQKVHKPFTKLARASILYQSAWKQLVCLPISSGGYCTALALIFAARTFWSYWLACLFCLFSNKKESYALSFLKSNCAGTQPQRKVLQKPLMLLLNNKFRQLCLQMGLTFHLTNFLNKIWENLLVHWVKYILGATNRPLIPFTCIQTFQSSSVDIFQFSFSEGLSWFIHWSCSY